MAPRRKENPKREAEGAAKRGAIEGGRPKNLTFNVGDGEKSFIAFAFRAHPSSLLFAHYSRQGAADIATNTSTSRLRVSDAEHGVQSPREKTLEAKFRVSHFSRNSFFFFLSIQNALCAGPSLPSFSPTQNNTTHRGWRPSRRRRWPRRGRWPWRGA